MGRPYPSVRNVGFATNPLLDITGLRCMSYSQNDGGSASFAKICAVTVILY